MCRPSCSSCPVAPLAIPMQRFDASNFFPRACAYQYLHCSTRPAKFCIPFSRGCHGGAMHGLHSSESARDCVFCADPHGSSPSATWLEDAANLPGKSMHLAVLLLTLSNIKETSRVVLSNHACERFGLDRNAKYRALLLLEKARLITVSRKAGRSPMVEIQSSGAAQIKSPRSKSTSI